MKPPRLCLAELKHPSVRTLTGAAFRVYVGLRVFVLNAPMDTTYAVFVSKRELGRALGLSRRSVSRAVVELRAVSLLGIEACIDASGRRLANRYEIIRPTLVEAE